MFASTGRSGSPAQYTHVNHVTYEDHDPEPFVWRGSAHESDEEDECNKPEDRKWEEFELPDCPEYAAENKSAEEEKQPTSGYIPIDLSQIPPELIGRDSNGSMGSESVESTSEQKEETPPPPARPPPKPPVAQPFKPTNELCENCGKRFCLGTPVHVFDAEEVRKRLGADVAKNIVAELAMRSGAPVPLPPRNPQETVSSILSIRDKTVVRTYAMWGSIFMFQKLILSIIRSLDKFLPSHEGTIQLSYHVRSQGSQN